MTWLSSNWGVIGSLTLAHLWIALPAIALSVLISVPIARWAAFSRRGGWVLSALSALYAVPSLPLLIVIPVIVGVALRSPANMIIVLTLYGVAVRLKRPLIASLISGFICGAVAGIAGLASHSMAAPGLFTSVQFFDPANPMTIVWVFGVMALAVVLSFVLTLMLGFEDIPQEEAAADARQRQAGAQASHA